MFFFYCLPYFCNICIFSSHFDYLIFNAVFFSLSLFLEFLLISESYHGLSSSRTTIVLLGMHNLANSIKIFVNNEFASLTVP